MKRWIAATLFLVCMYLPIHVFSAETFLYATETVNFRMGPGMEYAVIAELKSGEKVLMLGIFGNWTRVERQGVQGYVFSDYLSKEYVKTEKIAIARGTVNLREGPGSDYRRLGQVEKGDRLELIRVEGNWLEVCYEDGSAYVYKRYFTIREKKDGLLLAYRLHESDILQKRPREYLGIYLDEYDTLHIRVRNGADLENIYEELFNLLGGDFVLESSSLPSHVDTPCLENLSASIGRKYVDLSLEKKKKLGLFAWAYDPQEDQFIVELVNMDEEKIQLFRQWISDAEWISFISTEALAIPKSE